MFVYVLDSDVLAQIPTDIRYQLYQTAVRAPFKMPEPF